MITKETSNFSGFNFETGESLLIDKPLHWSSFKVVHIIRKITSIRKIGHAGTLDPAATGLLILCTGKKTKEIIQYQDLPKTYTGTITLGKTTPSMDIETAVSNERPITGIDEKNIFSVRDSFTGKIMQLPPMYSAIKHKGKSLYKFARKGKTIERTPREVEIMKFEITGISLPDITFEIVCSKGVYIRVIANDFGEKLGCGGYLTNLRRTAIGDFYVDNALTTEEFEERFKHFFNK